MSKGAASNGDGAGNTARGIGRYEHPGHDRIARELHDLRQRENELRGRWKEMGFELPQVSSENETPFTLPDPLPEEVISQRPAHIDLTSSRSHDTVDGPSAFETMSISSEASSTSSSNIANTSSTPSSTGNERQSSIKVRPYEDPDEVNDLERRPAWAAFSPQDETPIQREIRLAAEREQTLRMQRGLKPIESAAVPSFSTVSNSRQRQGGVGNGSHEMDLGKFEDYDDVVLRNGDASKSANNRLSLKNFASARLQLEIEREKQRELDLLRLGCIKTTSVDHIAPLVTNVDDDGDSGNYTHSNGGNWNSYVETISGQIEQQQNDANWDQKRSSVIRNGDRDNRKLNEPTKRWSTSGATGSRTNKTGNSGQQLRQSATSDMIERELRELELRERELRMQRADLTTNGHDVDDNDRSHEAEPPTENGVLRQRNRLSCALIDQWEDIAGRQ